MQSVSHLPELKVVKPSDTRWLSHERCIRAIRKELPALIITLQQLFEEEGDTEAYRLALVFNNFSGVACVIFLSQVLSEDKLRHSLEYLYLELEKIYLFPIQCRSPFLVDSTFSSLELRLQHCCTSDTSRKVAFPITHIIEDLDLLNLTDLDIKCLTKVVHARQIPDFSRLSIFIDSTVKRWC